MRGVVAGDDVVVARIPQVDATVVVRGGVIGDDVVARIIQENAKVFAVVQYGVACNGAVVRLPHADVCIFKKTVFYL